MATRHFARSTVTTASPHAANMQAVKTFLTATSAKLATLRKASTTHHHNLLAAATPSIVAMLANPTEATFTTVWDFIIAGKGESTQLPTIPTTALSRNVAIVYALFRQAVTGVDISNTTPVNLMFIAARLNCPSLIPFLVAQAKTMTPAAT